MDAAVALTGTYSFLLGRCTWEEDVQSALLEALALASDKPWREAATILAGRGKQLVERLREASVPEEAAS
jgi:hypothetical protein